MPLREKALELLRQMTRPDAEFREHQFEAIGQLVESRGRVLLVERTGFGKSAVYFIATKLLREEGRGPTLLVSPLLALMRNQLSMARLVNLKAATINSSNRKEWADIQDRIQAGEIDLLLISPERLNNPGFRKHDLPTLARDTGLLVIDEVHCISDWGHDFRPDYRRLAQVLQILPRGVPVLGTTATANNRVIADMEEQLGSSSTTFRGSLERESLSLCVRHLPTEPERLALLADMIPTLPGSGIVYCLTIEDTHVVATWLKQNGIKAHPYSGRTDPEQRPQLEQDLIDNRINVLVATSALGMGFDKPDLGFVIHYQSPGTPITYYQQVGRAGRAVDTAHGILLCGEEDRDIQDFFINSAFPPQSQAEAVVQLLDDEAQPVKVSEIMTAINIRKSRLDAMLKILEVEQAVENVEGGWRRTLLPWRYDSERVARVTEARRAEQAEMEAYSTSDQCRMKFLRHRLDDPTDANCGRCDNCTGVSVADRGLDPVLRRAAIDHLRSFDLVIEPRKQWVDIGNPDYLGNIPAEHRLEQGRVLSLYGDGGWGHLVRKGKVEDDAFADELVVAAAELIRDRWNPTPFPEWVTCVPSLGRPLLVRTFAEALAERLRLPFLPSVHKVTDNRPQKEMENSAQQLRNICHAFDLGETRRGPVLLVDDMVDSKWTLTVIGMLLRKSGIPAVYPFALAQTTSS